jgi:hypothetical protein
MLGASGAISPSLQQVYSDVSLFCVAHPKGRHIQRRSAGAGEKYFVYICDKKRQ